MTHAANHQVPDQAAEQQTEDHSAGGGVIFEAEKGQYGRVHERLEEALERTIQEQATHGEAHRDDRPRDKLGGCPHHGGEKEVGVKQHEQESEGDREAGDADEVQLKEKVAVRLTVSERDLESVGVGVKEGKWG